MATFAQDATGDLDFTTGNLVVEDDPATEAAINLNNGLQLGQGSWFLDERVGFPWIQRVLGLKDPNLDVLRPLFTNFFLKSPGIAEVLQFDLSFDAATRTLSCPDIRLRASSGAILLGALDRPFIVESTGVT